MGHGGRRPATPHLVASAHLPVPLSLGDSGRVAGERSSARSNRLGAQQVGPQRARPRRVRPEIGAHARGQGVGEAEDCPPGSVEPGAVGSAGGSRCTGQVSTPGFRQPRWVRGRCGAGVPPGRRAGAGRRGAGRTRGPSFGGSFALDSALTETGEARVPEDLGRSLSPRSRGRNLLHQICLSNFLLLPGGAGGSGSCAQLGRWRSVGYSGSPVRAGVGRRRTT